MKKLYHVHFSNGAICSRMAETEAEAIATIKAELTHLHNHAVVGVETETDPKAVNEWLALVYAENHGIVEYHVKGNKMIYYSSFPLEHSTIKATVNLTTMTETREYLKGYYKPYKSLVGGRYQSNYYI